MHQYTKIRLTSVGRKASGVLVLEMEVAEAPGDKKKSLSYRQEGLELNKMRKHGKYPELEQVLLTKLLWFKKARVVAIDIMCDQAKKALPSVYLKPDKQGCATT